ncbi:HNH endonuclease [Streptomyces sp. NPDC006393]|uniref:HNH endonuclease n=1 Tax=Streptomyces sp. NPDC006393 TaxID=3156763 RepID=UPI0033E43A51
MAAKIELAPKTGCWLWTGGLQRRGPDRGQVSYEGKTQLVHRVVFRLLVGEVPEGFQVRHADPWGRRYTLCCKPDPLEAVPQREALRRRDWEGARARRTHCPNGHAYSPENSYLDPRGFGSAGRVTPRGSRAAGFPRPCEIL